jgi:hypothetical protein
VGDFEGILRWLGHKEKPFDFKLEYDDGDVETLNVEDVRAMRREGRFLHHAGEEVAMVAREALPDVIDMAKAEGVRAVLEAAMPGHGEWGPGHITHLSRMTPAHPNFVIRRTATARADVELLQAEIDWMRVERVLDPFSGEGTIERVLGSHGQRVVSNDIDKSVRADMHVDALQPRFYRAAAKMTGATAVVTSPHFAVLDLFMSVVTLTAPRLPLVAVHAPGHYLTSGPRPRMRWFDKLAREGRLHVLFGSPRAVTGYRCVWICIFSSRHARRYLLRDKSAAARATMRFVA